MANGQIQSTSDRRGLMLLGYILTALVVAVLIVFGGRWVYHKVHKTSPQATPQTISTTSSSRTKQNSEKKLSGNNSSSKQSNPGSSSSSDLPDSGPGDVVTLFITVSLAAAGLHYVVKLKRA